MHFKLLFFTTFLVFTILIAGCGGSETPSNAVNANTNTTKGNTNNPLETTKKPEAPTTNNAPTLGPVVQAYYDALKKKDDAAVRKVLQQEFLKSIEADMKSEKKTNLAAFLAETDPAPENAMEVRNEKIEGDRATAELRGGAYPGWTTFVFVKENGVWKRSNEFPDIKAVTKSANVKK